MNEELRKKLPKIIRIRGAKGTLHKAGTYHEDGSWKTYIEYKFETSDLEIKFGINRKKGLGLNPTKEELERMRKKEALKKIKCYNCGKTLDKCKCKGQHVLTTPRFGEH